MATNEQNLPPEAVTPGGTSAAGGAASAFERPVPPVAQPEVAISPPAAEAPEMIIAGEPRSRLVSLARTAGHYLGAAVRTYRNTRSEGVGERAKRMVREHPSSLAGAAAAGYVVGRVLRGRV